jgi:GNAT superfamily N-acetyltransferase
VTAIHIIKRSDLKRSGPDPEVDRRIFDLKFARLPEQIRRDPYRVGLLPVELWLQFLHMPMPFEREFWVAEGSGTPVGRIGTNVSLSYPGTGYFGFFEVDVAHDHAESIARDLLEEAHKWMKQHGIRKIYGPICFNTWFPYRFRMDEQNEAFDDEKFTWEPVNPPQYVQYLVQNGFRVEEIYHSKAWAELDKVRHGTMSGYEKALAGGITFRGFDAEHLIEKEVPVLYELSMANFAENFLFEPIDLEAFRQLYVPIARKIDLSYCFFALEPQDQRPIGFVFAFEDRGYLAIKTIALNKAFRGRGISNGMMHFLMNRALEGGIRHAIGAMAKGGAQSESYGRKTPLLWRHEYALFSKEVS